MSGQFLVVGYSDQSPQKAKFSTAKILTIRKYISVGNGDAGLGDEIERVWPIVHDPKNI